ncbi:MAG: GlxA family transcriptional regulator [Porticoccaceae bacterium]|jgi:transcriptional regulator GlxA family with amidase domain|nr:GlxA family transcriptional regulator [Porticoccaceae bacterium]MBT4210580.1 GlxA family transcriptional regulator [Porticoccaceae bacterium]MBT4591218.1 GlxA family transcriptional regulator [Porticoccaceae bacterium]MBT5004370.1 GlxA family transcriptional regulator [Porticoccaceae bacterium]MBT5104482.1 GlxA family transcriptional regulator [Porticoccaceae bacterium]
MPGDIEAIEAIEVEAVTLHIGFVMLPEYTLSTFSNAVGILRMANRLSGKELYHWSLHSVGGQSVVSSAGLELALDGGLDAASEADIMLVCGGYSVKSHCDKPLLDGLRKMAKRKIPMGGICTGSYALAAAGLLDGYRCTIHWENLASLREEFPKLEISSSLFVIDRDRYTCSGGISSIDLMLNLVASIHGHQLVQQISEQFTCDRVRTEKDAQRAPLKYLIGASQPRLVEAVTLMENNIEEPLTLDEISNFVGISRRQLERLFNRYLHCAPSRYYLELRLYRARLLLLQTSIPVIDVAISCGFSTAPHFSKCYSDLYSKPPSSERRALI